ncbi:MAG: nucleotidyltransferase domain-containing protein [Burkholderiales bacterium]
MPVEELARQLSQALAPREEVLEAYLFGSQATGKAQAHSDVDIAVYVDDSKDRRALKAWRLTTMTSPELFSACFAVAISAWCVRMQTFRPATTAF